MYYSSITLFVYSCSTFKGCTSSKLLATILHGHLCDPGLTFDLIWACSGFQKVKLFYSEFPEVKLTAPAAMPMHEIMAELLVIKAFDIMVSSD